MIRGFNVAKYELLMKTKITRFDLEIKEISVGRPSSNLLSSIELIKDGKKIKLVKIAEIHSLDQKSLIVSLPDELVTTLAESAIRKSSLGLNPSRIDSSILKVPIPMYCLLYIG